MKGKINRLKFLKLSVTGVIAAGAAALFVKSDRLFSAMGALENSSKTIPNDAKNVFSKCGACSHTFYHLLNREFGYTKAIEERASDPLAGGLMNTQHQCGMLWGSALAAGAESFRRHDTTDQATSMALTATQRLVESLTKRAKSVNCRDIVDCDISNKIDIATLLLKSLPGGFNNMICMNLAEKWMPEAIQSAREGLSDAQTDLHQQPVSCASEVVKIMEGGNEEIVTVAGLAGGIGLSGNACGALGAAIWMNTLAWCRKNPGKSGYLNPGSQEILNTFKNLTGSEFACNKISGQCFKTIGDHTEFIKTGGCGELINKLALS